MHSRMFWVIVKAGDLRPGTGIHVPKVSPSMWMGPSEPSSWFIVKRSIPDPGPRRGLACAGCALKKGRALNPIGIMQGRLSPPEGGRIQSFPVHTWRQEFALAREAGLDCIESVYEVDTESANPLRTLEGVAEIANLSRQSGVAVWSVCADYYMQEHLVAGDGKPRGVAVTHLIGLLQRAAPLGLKYLVLPFVDASSLKSSQGGRG